PGRWIPFAWIVSAFSIAALSPLAFGAPADSTSLPFVTSITTLPAIPCPGQPTRIIVSGAVPTACGHVAGKDDARLLIAVIDPAPPCAFCVPVITPWADTLDVGRLAAGFYRAVLTLAVIDPCSFVPDPTFYKTVFDFSVP